jgi:hypothetical protein
MPPDTAGQTPNLPDASRLGDTEKHLRRREAARKAKVFALLLFGVPALFFGPVILGSIYWLLGLIWGFYVPWIWVFLGSFIVLTPLLFWTEWRTGGSYYTDAILSTHSKSDRAGLPLTGLSHLDFLVGFARHPRDPAIGLVELFLWGPRQILEALRTLRGVRAFAAVNRQRAAEILLALLACNHADPAILMPRGDSAAAMVGAYMLWYDWIGVAKDNHRVWLDSDSRAILNG